MKIINAEVVLEWENGRKVHIGTLETTADDNGMVKAKVRHMRQRIGWEFVRTGFMIMFHGRKWRETYD